VGGKGRGSFLHRKKKKEVVVGEKEDKCKMERTRMKGRGRIERRAI